MAETTTIRLKERTADELHDRKGRGDSYDDVVRRLLEQSDEQSDEPQTAD